MLNKTKNRTAFGRTPSSGAFDIDVFRRLQRPLQSVSVVIKSVWKDRRDLKGTYQVDGDISRPTGQAHMRLGHTTYAAGDDQVQVDRAAFALEQSVRRHVLRLAPT